MCSHIEYEPMLGNREEGKMGVAGNCTLYANTEIDETKAELDTRSMTFEYSVCHAIELLSPLFSLLQFAAKRKKHTIELELVLTFQFQDVK
jgi:hypothetical protein